MINSLLCQRALERSETLPPAVTQALRRSRRKPRDRASAPARVAARVGQAAGHFRADADPHGARRSRRWDGHLRHGVVAHGAVQARLPELAAPEEDRGALESDVRKALQPPRGPRAASAEARLGRKSGGQS